MNTVITFTPALLWQAIAGICGAIMIVSSALGVIVGLVKRVQSPNQMQNERLKSIEQRLDEHDKYFKMDKERFDEVEKMMKLLVKSNRALLRHGIDGNEVDGMKQAECDINDYLIEK